MAITDIVRDENFEPRPGPSHLDIGAAARAIAQSKAVGGVFQGDGGLAHQPAALRVSPEVHGLRAIDEMDRLFYPFCVCGAVGRGFLTPDRAKHFECPRQAAEIEVAANWAEYERAVEFVSGGPRR